MSASDFEDDRVCSTLRWKDVVLPKSVTAADVDASIFAEMDEDWLKVARIVGNAFDTWKRRSVPLSMEMIAARIRELAELGHIESQGNLTMWRHSEIRLLRH